MVATSAMACPSAWSASLRPLTRSANRLKAPIRSSTRRSMAAFGCSCAVRHRWDISPSSPPQSSHVARSSPSGADLGNRRAQVGAVRQVVAALHGGEVDQPSHGGGIRTHYLVVAGGVGALHDLRLSYALLEQRRPLSRPEAQEAEVKHQEITAGAAHLAEHLDWQGLGAARLPPEHLNEPTSTGRGQALPAPTMIDPRSIGPLRPQDARATGVTAGEGVADAGHEGTARRPVLGVVTWVTGEVE